MAEQVQFTCNGVAQSVNVDPDTPLIHVLRQDLGLTGSHLGCGLNQCGACNVLVDGQVIASCDAPLWSVSGKRVVTVEGLGNPDNPHPLQRAFIEEQAAQCGYCISGILISAVALLEANPNPTEAEIRAALDNNLCRCGVHLRILRAVNKAASRIQEASAT